MNKIYVSLCLALLMSSTMLLSGCGYDPHHTHKSGEVMIRQMVPPNVTLTDVRHAYKDSSVEIYDLNYDSSAYNSGSIPVPRGPVAPLNTQIPVKDKSVEIYDIGLVSPSHTRQDYNSPFEVIEDTPSLTDPFADEDRQISVIVPSSPNDVQDQDQDTLELMTGF